MSFKYLLICTAAAGLLAAGSVGAVDLVGVHDLALKNDPRLRAAGFRRDATSENRYIARANLLPQIGAGGTWAGGESETKVAGQRLPARTTDPAN